MGPRRLLRTVGLDGDRPAADQSHRARRGRGLTVRPGPEPPVVGDATTASPVGRPALRWALVALCLTQITSWGVLYYAFPVLADALATDTGWSRPSVTAAFSASLIVSAAVGVPVGRILDRRGPRPVMTAGSSLAVVAVVGVAAAPTLTWFCAAWLLAGAAPWPASSTSPHSPPSPAGTDRNGYEH
jgi:Major Facilitator Superfamily